MPFSYDKAWADLVAMLRANWAVLIALTGAFIFFPAFALLTYAPMPEGDPNGNPFELIRAYYEANLVWFVLVNAISAYGQAAILVLLLDLNRPTVGDALRIAGWLFPSFLVAQILTNLAIGFGFVLLIVPGLYLLGRLSITGPLIADRRERNPIEAIAQGWRATDGIGWRIVGLFLLVVIVAWVAFSAATSALTVLGSLIVAESARPIVGGFAGALSSAALGLLIILLTAAIYRQIDGGRRVSDVFS